MWFFFIPTKVHVTVPVNQTGKWMLLVANFAIGVRDSRGTTQCFYKFPHIVMILNSLDLWRRFYFIVLVALCNNKWEWSGTLKQIVLLYFAFSFSLRCSMTLHKSPLTSYAANRLVRMRPKILGHSSDAHPVLWS